MLYKNTTNNFFRAYFFRKNSDEISILNSTAKIIPTALICLLWSYITTHSFGYGHKVIYCITTLLILYGLCHASKTSARFFVIVITVSSLLLNPATSRFGSPNINMVAAVKYTNSMETMELIRNLSIINISMLLLIAISGFLVLKTVNKINTKKKSAVAAIIISLMVITYKPIFASTPESFSNKLGYPPLKVALDVSDAIQTIIANEESFKNHQEIASDFKPVVTNRKNNTYVLVVGESVRRDYMGLYGFPVNNTPFLSTANGVFFDNYVSSSYATVPSLTHSLMLSKDGELQFNNNILRLAKASGLKTYWLSNQGVFGIHDSPVAMIGKDADYSYFIKKGDSNDGEYLPDEALLPEYTRVMQEKGDKLIVLHLIGSHSDACARTNGLYDVKLRSDEISCYVQSIKNTDHLLKQIADTATQSGSAWSLIYFADHGLSHFDDRKSFAHLDKYKENYSPPFVMINQKATKPLRISEARSGLDFMSIFAQWIGVEDTQIKIECNYFDNVQCSSSVTVLDGSLRPTDFYSLPSDPA